MINWSNDQYSHIDLWGYLFFWAKIAVLINSNPTPTRQIVAHPGIRWQRRDLVGN